MKILTVALIVVLKIHYASLLHKKCCAADSYLKKNNSVYVCDKDNDKRLQIFTNQTNFLETSTEGTCYDTFPNITEYKIKNQTVVDEKIIPVNFYPKCCPLGYFYHSVAHSCVRRDNLDEGFITQNFIKVGLPACRVIVDYDLIPGRYSMELGKLYIDESRYFLEGHFCIDKEENDGLLARGCYDDLSVCYDETRCIHKCCPDGQSFVNGRICENTYENGLNLSFTDRVNNSEDSFAIIHNLDCRLHFLKDKIPYYLDTVGAFHVFYNQSNSFHHFDLNDKAYCIEHLQKGPRNNFYFFGCIEESPLPVKFVVARWAKIVSCIFIVITIGVYLLLPEMLNLFGKILISYCLVMLVSFASFAYAQFGTNIGDDACLGLSFFLSYMSLASFAWLNVMCFDIWRTFGSPRSFITPQQRYNEFKKFLLYSLYGWGLPAVITLVTFIAYQLETPFVVKPILGGYKCFWNIRPGNYGKIIFHLIPLILMGIGNAVLFLRTLFYCLKVKREINRMNENRISAKEKKKTYKLDKEQLFLIFKLSVIMGISFLFEVVSSVVDFSINPVTQYVEAIWDTINCLQGVFIFLIFICKVKMYHLCINRFVTRKERKISQTSLPTYTTQMSEPLSKSSY